MPTKSAATSPSKGKGAASVSKKSPSSTPTKKTNSSAKKSPSSVGKITTKNASSSSSTTKGKRAQTESPKRTYNKKSKLTETTSSKDKFIPVLKKDYTTDDFEFAANYLKSKTAHRPCTAIILGSGMGDFINAIEDQEILPYTEVEKNIPHFPTCSVPGHSGNFIFGTMSGISLMVMQGRFHLYEGHSAQAITFPIRIMKHFGITDLLITNAAGGLSPNLKMGDVMIINDHFNTAWGFNHPLLGKNIDEHGPRFLPAGHLYSKHYRNLAKEVAKEKKIPIKQGVYVYATGPSFETPYEVRLFTLMSESYPIIGPFLKHMKTTVGGDETFLGKFVQWCKDLIGVHESAVGMSTVPEVLVANHCGLSVFAVSGIPNMAIPEIDSEEVVSHEEVCAGMRDHVVPNIISLFRGLVEKIASEKQQPAMEA